MVARGASRMKGPKTMRALRAVLTAAIAHACAAFAPAAGSLGLRAFAPDRAHSRGLIGRIADAAGGKRRPAAMAMMSLSKIQELNKGAWEARLAALEKQAILDFQTAIREFYSQDSPLVLTTALIAGDQVILHILKKAGLLNREIKVVFIDTFHLFDETLDFLKEMERHYGFKAHVYRAEGCATREDFDEKYGDDLFLADVEEYDSVAKVEPLMRALRESGTKLWINGRRRDQGFERAELLVWEHDKLNPLTFWTFEDCWKYIARENVPYHPLHDDGYPSIGDLHSTLRIDKSQWYQYGMERAGRFIDMQDSDGD